MADGSYPLDPRTPRQTFLIEARALEDILLRLLGPFAVQGAVIVAAELVVSGALAMLRLETEGLAPDRAAHVAERLRALPAVLAVGVGWRVAA